jgi:hypothetical protein
MRKENKGKLTGREKMKEIYKIFSSFFKSRFIFFIQVNFSMLPLSSVAK